MCKKYNLKFQITYSNKTSASSMMSYHNFKSRFITELVKTKFKNRLIPIISIFLFFGALFISNDFFLIPLNMIYKRRRALF